MIRARCAACSSIENKKKSWTWSYKSYSNSSKMHRRVTQACLTFPFTTQFCPWISVACSVRSKWTLWLRTRWRAYFCDSWVTFSLVRRASSRPSKQRSCSSSSGLKNPATHSCSMTFRFLASASTWACTAVWHGRFCTASPITVSQWTLSSSDCHPTIQLWSSSRTRMVSSLVAFALRSGSSLPRSTARAKTSSLLSGRGIGQNCGRLLEITQCISTVIAVALGLEAGCMAVGLRSTWGMTCGAVAQWPLNASTMSV